MSLDNETSEVTRWIQQALDGDRAAEEQLVEAVYDRLYGEAQRLIAASPGSVRATQLVNDVWIRIFRGCAEPQLATRHVFMAYAARAMRNLLLDSVKRKRAQKHGGDVARELLPLDGLVGRFESLVQVDLMTLNDALEQLRADNERYFRTVELRFFGGMTMREIAEVHGVSLATAERDWVIARAKLRYLLRGSLDNSR